MEVEFSCVWSYSSTKVYIQCRYLMSTWGTKTPFANIDYDCCCVVLGRFNYRNTDFNSIVRGDAY